MAPVSSSERTSVTIRFWAARVSAADGLRRKGFALIDDGFSGVDLGMQGIHREDTAFNDQINQQITHRPNFIGLLWDSDLGNSHSKPMTEYT